jgi:hypothetical protein
MPVIFELNARLTRQLNHQSWRPCFSVERFAAAHLHNETVCVCHAGSFGLLLNAFGISP